MSNIKNYDNSGIIKDEKERASSAEITELSKKRAQNMVETLYKENKADLCAWLQKRYNKNKSDAEELTHRAFSKMLELDSLSHIRNPKAFLYTVAVNFALLDVRAHATSQKFVEQELKVFSRNVEEITPERIYSSQVRFKSLAQGMERLTPKQKEILRLSRIEGKTYAQIQQQTGWSQADISRQLKKSLSLIREELASKANNQG